MRTRSEFLPDCGLYCADLVIGGFGPGWQEDEHGRQTTARRRSIPACGRFADGLPTRPDIELTEQSEALNGRSSMPDEIATADVPHAEVTIPPADVDRAFDDGRGHQTYDELTVDATMTQHRESGTPRSIVGQRATGHPGDSKPRSPGVFPVLMVFATLAGIIFAAGYSPNYRSFLEAEDIVASDDGTQTQKNRNTTNYFVGFRSPVSGLLREISKEAVQVAGNIVRIAYCA